MLVFTSFARGGTVPYRVPMQQMVLLQVLEVVFILRFYKGLPTKWDSWVTDYPRNGIRELQIFGMGFVGYRSADRDLSVINI
jgi:hypothetical protein